MFLFALSLPFVLTFVSSLLFKFLVVAFIAMSAIMTVGVPVVYTTVEDQEQVRSLIGRGSITWFALLVLVAVTTFFVA